MSGIYIHIPFCKQACHYCDFHFITSLKHKEELVDAICKEIKTRKDFLPTKKIDTVYFGGGTPSLLDSTSLKKIFVNLHEFYDLSSLKECTLEANPDDITKETLLIYQSLGINRLSLGIQSFNEENLRFLNRAHSAQQAKETIELALELDFQISIDLIYGIQTSTLQTWKNDLNILYQYDIDHLSAYCLTIEEKTVFGNWVKKKKIDVPDDDLIVAQYDHLQAVISELKFEQYEISNFARNKRYAVHNTSYWKQKPYLGLGPSAHSYDLKNRYINYANNASYVKAINENEAFYQTEKLSGLDQLNEYILTSLRTIWGTDLNHNLFELITPSQKEHIQTSITSLLAKELISIDQDVVYLTEKGKLYADSIAEELFL